MSKDSYYIQMLKGKIMIYEAYFRMTQELLK